MTRFKMFSPVLLFTIASALLGCSGSEPNEKTKIQIDDDNKPSADETTSYISPLPDDAPVYKVATEADYEPFVLQDAFGKSDGLDVDLIRAIGEDQGFKVEFHTMTWKQVFPSLLEKNQDIAISGIHILPDQLNNFGISAPYLKDNVEIVSNASNPINSVSDLEGKVIGAQNGTTHVELAKAIKDVKLSTKDTTYELFEEMVQGQTDAFLVDKSIALHFVQEYPESKVVLKPLSNEVINIAFYTNKDNTELLNKINQGLENIKANGKYQQINQKWFGESANELIIQ